MKKKKQKRPITLIEIMIVILLIGLIGGALAFNMRGSMDHGRKFKTEQAQRRIQDILQLELASGKSSEEVQKQWENIVKTSPMGNGDALLKDGWGDAFQVSVKDDTVVVTSKKLAAHEEKNKPSKS